MSHIISVFKYIISPFRYLWKSSVLSIRKMTHGYNRFIKSDSSIRDEQNIFSKKETQMMSRENKKMSTHDNLRQSSQNFLKKLRKITLSSTSSNQNEEKSNPPPEKTLSDTTKTTSESNGEFKLKVSSMK